MSFCKDAKPAESVLGKALSNDSPDVGIAAAEAIGNLSDQATALTVLTKALKHDELLVYFSWAGFCGAGLVDRGLPPRP